MIRASMVISPSRPENQDRAAAIRVGEATVLVLADGAGGMSGGGRAAQFVTDFVRERAEDLAVPLDADALCSVLRAADFAMTRSSRYGETTGVLAVVCGDQVAGASVGDSGAWMVANGRAFDLTVGQRRRPMIGAGGATPMAFGPRRLAGRLVIASDGLFKYVNRDRIIVAASTGTVDEAAHELAAAPRLPGGRYPDDVSVIVCEGA